jgi:hypothetical protein
MIPAREVLRRTARILRSEPSRFHRLAAALALATFLFSTMLSSCTRTDLSFSVLTRISPRQVQGVGRMEVIASCSEDEELVGGGYSLVPRPRLGAPQLAIEASYPSGRNGWTVTVFNPDNANAGTVVIAAAYCLKGPVLPVRIERVQSAPVQAVFDEVTTTSALCPQGSVLTAGGYETDHTTPSAGSYNAWLLRSAPVVDGAGIATGWEVQQHVISWIGSPARPRTTVYVLCAREKLQAGTAVQRQVFRTAPYYWWYYEGEVRCAPGQFSVGGGYGFDGDPLIPHGVYASQSRIEFEGWWLGGIYGQERETQSRVFVSAVCLREPELPLVVRITSPDRLSYVGVGSRLPGGGARSEPLTFTAIATDGAGNPVPGVSYDWFVNVLPLGSGPRLDATLPAAPGCGWEENQITVRARDGRGNAAFDSVTVLAGTLC